ncbi:carboxymuconolactone decarboxylase family protein [Candidatus Magnetomonas plexicatena]|uniref:carboxymuconolactone decarboxylase family protein n=1 Tax=Candidatus Magnetomonas plexicatena TaxID=2552947 RepID=UPI001101A50C|nr:hypothetical protein E2O03_011455 [Nitrospirales bacterium LBB_01]
MPLIKTVKPEEAAGKTAEIFAATKERLGRVPNVYQLYAVTPTLFEVQSNVMGYFMNHPTLSMGFLAFVRMLVSVGTNCVYCIDFNKNMLIQSGIGADVLNETIKDPKKAPLPEKEKALLLFVLKAVKNPRSVDGGDVDELRNLGWSDQDILDAVIHGANNAAADIIIDTFKVEKE